MTPVDADGFAQGHVSHEDLVRPGEKTAAFERTMQVVHAGIASERWYEALHTLSDFYSNGEFSEQERRELLDLLDQLAGKVIYSNEHLMDTPYVVRRRDTLMDIAERYNVPSQLLANINGITNPEVLVPGTQLKVVPGPFRAELDLSREELTLFVGSLYAGRFPIAVGPDFALRPGQYRVNDKRPGRTYWASNGRPVPANDPSNPYGGVWLDLDGDLCLHGRPQTGDLRLACISLSPGDANDVYGILSRGSRVSIRR
jgi:LysM repeat protein